MKYLASDCGYGDIVNLQEALEFISKNGVCVIATCGDGKPEAATVIYVFKDGYFLINTYKESRKVNNIRKNKNVALVVGTSRDQPSVQINGVAEILTGDEDKKARKLFWELGFRKYSQDPENIYLKIKPLEFWCNGKRI